MYSGVAMLPSSSRKSWWLEDTRAGYTAGSGHGSVGTTRSPRDEGIEATERRSFSG